VDRRRFLATFDAEKSLMKAARLKTPDSLEFFIDHIATPLGELVLVSDNEGRLRTVGFTDGHARIERELKRSIGADGALTPARDPGGFSSALRAYFKGDLNAIEGLPVAGQGTEFQTQVWRALSEIPCGETRSYADIARRIKNPAAVRAVGLANGANPIGIVVPCHRVIGADGSLTGYGAGVERKRWLLDHERAGASKRR
jgi:methylated-DNA-[protein]-cysteine S-methyltransferase